MRGLAGGFCSAKEDPWTIFPIPMLVSFCFVDENAGYRRIDCRCQIRTGKSTVTVFEGSNGKWHIQTS